MHRRIALILVLLFCCTGGLPARGAGTRSNSGEREIALCIRRASAGRAWLERTLWGLRDQEAGWVGARLRNGDGSHDLGPLQVNSWWVPRVAELIDRRPEQVRWWLTHDACFNVDVARWIFLAGLAGTHNYWKAVGAYHSPTPWRQKAYARLVAERLRARFGDALFRSIPDKIR
jgi:hypothetical protein